MNQTFITQTETGGAASEEAMKALKPPLPGDPDPAQVVWIKT
tara:strand:+ start:95117 stop:95242 length:126 start_codon:yes stop_codon:yes gene_type:complete